MSFSLLLFYSALSVKPDDCVVEGGGQAKALAPAAMGEDKTGASFLLGNSRELQGVKKKNNRQIKEQELDQTDRDNLAI